MTRDDILSRAMLKQPHPRYGFLTAGKYEALSLLGNRMLTGEQPDTSDIGAAWCVCVLGPESPEVQQALKEGAAALRPIWSESFHASEIAPFIAWFNSEWEDVEAASTKARKDPKGGKDRRE